jgi:hypothetical protein
MKICPKCKIEKPLTAFAKHARRSDGVQSRCRQCNSEYDKIRYKTYWKDQVKKGNDKERTRRREYIWEYLLSHSCVDCGESNPIVLQFDHQRDKLASVSSIVGSWAWTRVLQEIEKCVIRCANCHMIKTANDPGWYLAQRV